MTGHRRTGATLGGIFVVWLVAVSSGLGLAWRHAQTPGQAARATNWPPNSTLAHDKTRYTLLIFAHPRCPCTRATLSELARLLARCPDNVATQVLFTQPERADKAWTDTDTVRGAALIAGVRVQSDPDAREARRFGAATSGQAFLYSRQGRLLFAGGLTAARGHEGDNAGSEAVSTLLRSAKPAEIGMQPPLRTPVFGCALFARSETPGSPEPRTGVALETHTTNHTDNQKDHETENGIAR